MASKGKSDAKRSAKEMEERRRSDSEGFRILKPAPKDMKKGKRAHDGA
ncbi:MAG: hypothetical protein SOY67_08305 [Collinsella sp.]|nr:hypothetical protein [Collinsella sp.]